MSDKSFPIPGDKPIVYVREADREILPDHLKAVPGKLFAVHDPEGNVIALAENRALAFAMARRNDLEPVSVH